MDFVKGTEEYLFVQKLKPAILFGINHRYVESFKEEYAFFMVDDLRIVFYHDESTLELWETEMKALKKKKDMAKAIGTVLGYPPKAVKGFNLEDSVIVNPIRVNYHGLFFVSNGQTYKEDLKWLIENTPIPEEHRTFIELTYKGDSGTFDKHKRIDIK